MSHHSPSTPTAFPIGIVIPTYNRADVLIRCLNHLENQTWTEFEVVVVDDGSTDGTREQVEAYAAQTPLTLRYVHQENSGQARARNRGIAMLRAPVCLMIGDDILASPELVAQHLDLHSRCHEERIAGLGYTHWAEQGQVVTPFMHWLNEEGWQFAYGELRRGTPPSWRHFYTSNLSMKTNTLRAQPFDETFRKYGFEDIELGYRLEMQGTLKMVFLPKAVAEHLHPTDVAQTCKRITAAGAATLRFEQLWPEHRQAPAPHGLRKRVRSVLMEKRWTLALLRSAAALLTRVWCPNPLLRRVLLLHHQLGYREAAGGSGL